MIATERKSNSSHPREERNPQQLKLLVDVTTDKNFLDRAKVFFKSSNAVRIPSAFEKFDVIKDIYGVDVAAELSSSIGAVITSAASSSPLREKIIDNNSFHSDLITEWNKSSLKRNRRLGMDLGSRVDDAFQRFYSTDVTQNKDTLKDKLHDTYLSTVGRVMRVGKQMESIDSHKDKNPVVRKVKSATAVIGKGMAEAPILWQMKNDMANTVEKVVDNNAKELEQRVADVALFYGIPKEENPFIQNPALVSRVLNSLALNQLYYTKVRDIVGWGAYGLLLTNRQFREAVESNSLGVTLATVGLLAGGMAARMQVDKKILQDVGWSPDILETAGSILTGKRDTNNKIALNIDPWVKIGVLSDVMISLLPPYGLALLTNPPYSIPSYLAAVAVDQLTFLSANSAFYAINKLNNKRKDKEQNGNS